MTRQDVLNHFLDMAKIARQGYFFAFNAQTSCLKPMVEALRNDVPSGAMTIEGFRLVRSALEAKSPKDSQKYQDALKYVEHNWPNWNRTVTGVKIMGTVPTGTVLRHIPVPPKVPPKPVSSTSVGVVPVGWQYENYNSKEQKFTTPVIPTEALPPLHKTEISRINEAFKRARLAVEMARDAMINTEKLNWSGSLNNDQRLFRYYFGSYDSVRFKTVLNNFKVLTLAFQKGPKVIDLRNTEYGKTCYAACYRRDLRSVVHNSLTITRRVEMFLGREFLKSTSSYVSSTDNTVGTLIHEFAHGSINAVDAPPVESGTWKRNPKHAKLPERKKPDSDPPHPDFGESPVNSIQASTDSDDHILADFAPDIAIRNADNYGQFARSLLIRKSI